MIEEFICVSWKCFVDELVDNFVYCVWNVFGDVFNFICDFVCFVWDCGGEIVDDVINIVDGGGDGRFGVFNCINCRVICGGECWIDDVFCV